MNIFSVLMNTIKEHTKTSLWSGLIRSGSGISSTNFFLICTTIIGTGLLIVVPFSIIWEELHNNSVISDLSGWAAYIGAIAGLFGAAGATKSWSNYADRKFYSGGYGPNGYSPNGYDPNNAIYDNSIYNNSTYNNSISNNQNSNPDDYVPENIQEF